MKTTVSNKIYIFFLIIAIVFLGIYVFRFNLGQNCVADIFLSFSSGVASSIIVSWVIDIANTKRQDIEDNKLFNRLTKKFDMACEELLTEFVVAAQEAYGIDDKRRVFVDWVKLLLDNNNADEKILQEANYALQQVSEVNYQAKLLLKYSKIYLNNKCFDDDFWKRINKISNLCKRIEFDKKRGNYTNCLKWLVDDLVEALIEYKSDMTYIFKEPYNWDVE